MCCANTVLFYIRDLSIHRLEPIPLLPPMKGPLNCGISNDSFALLYALCSPFIVVED